MEHNTVKRYLVLDTNTWVYKTNLLCTALGASVIYSVKRSKIKIALPDVIEQEIKKHTYLLCQEAVEKIEENHRKISSLMGYRVRSQVPADNEMRNRATHRLAELSGMIHKVEWTLGHAQSALKRVMDDSPPNSKGNQQYKDSLIWEAILDLAESGDVDFVTQDKSFFEGKNIKKGLALRLKEDASKTPGSINVFYELSDFLPAIKNEVDDLKEEDITRAIDNKLRGHLTHIANHDGYQIGSIVCGVVKKFLTGVHDVISIDYKLKYETIGVLVPGAEEVIDAELNVHGNCSYNLDMHEVFDNSFDRLKMLTVDGKRLPLYETVFLKTNKDRGMVAHRFKDPLD